MLDSTAPLQSGEASLRKGCRVVSQHTCTTIHLFFAPDRGTLLREKNFVTRPYVCDLTWTGGPFCVGRHFSLRPGAHPQQIHVGHLRLQADDPGTRVHLLATRELFVLPWHMWTLGGEVRQRLRVASVFSVPRPSASKVAAGQQLSCWSLGSSGLRISLSEAALFDVTTSKTVGKNTAWVGMYIPNVACKLSVGYLSGKHFTFSSCLACLFPNSQSLSTVAICAQARLHSPIRQSCC